MTFHYKEFEQLMTTDFGDAGLKAPEGITYTRDHPFVPVIGLSYEVYYGHVTIRGQSGWATAKIRVDGRDSSQWIDLDTGELLDPVFRAFVVQAFKPI